MGKKNRKNRKKKQTKSVIKQTINSLENISEDSGHPMLLYLAAREGDIELFDRLIKQGYKINFREPVEKATPLGAAAMHGHLEIAKRLIAEGAHVDLSDIDGFSPLRAAASKNHAAVVKLLILAGADVNSICHRDGTNPLQLAAELGHIDVVESLLQSDNIIINAQSEKDGSTALWRAAYRGHVDVIKILLDHGADLHIGQKGMLRPLHAAAADGHTAAVEFLIKSGHFIDAIDDNGRTSLFSAVSAGHLDIVSILLDNGADINRTTTKGTSSLWVAVQHKHIDIVQILIQRGADVNFTLGGDVECSLLHLAMAKESSQILKLLLNSPKIKILDNESYTPLHLVAEWNLPKLIPEILNSRKVDINHRDSKGSTPLFMATLRGSLEVVKKLIEAGADVNIPDNDRMYTPLHLAALGKPEGYLEIIKILLESQNIDINRRAKDCTTVLHYAVGNIKLLSLLLKAGANPLIQGGDGKTPLELAQNQQKRKSIKILSKFTNKFLKRADISKEVLLSIDQIKLWHFAIKNGQIEIIQSMLFSGTVDVNSRDHTSGTALHYAANNEYLDVIDLLLQFKNIEIDVCEYANLVTPLHLAASKNRITAIQIILRNGGLQSINKVAMEGTPLTSAVLRNHIEAVLELTKAGADINESNSLGHTPLHVAVQKGYLDIILMLLQQPAIDTNVMDYQCNTPLMTAIHTGRVDVVHLLLDSGKVDVNWGLDSYPLHLAVIKGNLEILRVILQAENLDSEKAMDNGYTALHFAAYKGDTTMIKMLVQGDTKLVVSPSSNSIMKYLSSFIYSRMTSPSPELLFNDALKEKIYQNTTPLHVAIESGNINAAMMLISYGINVNVPNNKGFFPIHLAAAQHSILVIERMLQVAALDVNAVSLGEGVAAIHSAISSGNIGILRLLLQAPNINLDIVDKVQGVTPLLLAIKQQNVQVVKMLVNAGADVNLSGFLITPLMLATAWGNLEIIKLLISSNSFNEDYFVPSYKSTPLHVAFELNRVDIINFFIEKYLYINHGDSLGATPLHAAISVRNFKAVKELIDRGVNIDFQNKAGLTALHAASSENNIECLNLLIKHGADINLRSIDGYTPLMIAVVKGNSLAVRVLLELKADLNIGDANQFDTMPIHMATESGYLDIVELLLGYGANVNSTTTLDVTPLHLAARRGEIKMVEYLLKKEADLNATDNCGETPLHYASFFKRLSVVKLLLDYGADQKILNEDGRLASQLTHVYSVKKYLLEQDVKAQNIAVAKKNKIFIEDNILEIKSASTVEHGNAKNIFKSAYYQDIVATEQQSIPVYKWSVDGQGIKSDDSFIHKIQYIGGGDLYVVISRSLESKLDNTTLVKLHSAIDKGFVRSVGQNGLKKIKNKLIVLKINEDIRLYTDTVYLNLQKQKLIIFENFCIHSQLQNKINDSQIHLKQVEEEDNYHLSLQNVFDQQSWYYHSYDFMGSTTDMYDMKYSDL